MSTILRAQRFAPVLDSAQGEENNVTTLPLRGVEPLNESERDELMRLRAEAAANRLATTELATLRQEAARLRIGKANSDRDAVELKAVLREAEAQVLKTRETISFQLGNAIIVGLRGPRGMLGLPAAIRGIILESRRRKLRRAATTDSIMVHRPAAQMQVVTDALAVFESNGLAAAEAWVEARKLKPEIKARVLVELAKSLRKLDLQAAARLGCEAIALDRNQHRVKWLAFVLADAGGVDQSAEILEAVIRSGATFSAAESRRSASVFALSRLRRDLNVLTPRAEVRASLGAGERRVMIVASKGIHDHWTPSSQRSHALAQHLLTASWNPRVITAPGYAPRKVAGEGSGDVRIVDMVPYHHCPETKAEPEVIDQYATEAAMVLVDSARAFSPTLIQCEWAAGLSLAAVNAARKLGVPFVLDVAEIVPDDSRRPAEWYKSRHYETLLSLCVTVASGSDLVVARSAAVRNLLVGHGVPAEKVLVVPDIVRSGRNASSAAPVTQALQGMGGHRIGYVGNLGGCLFDVVSAFADLVDEKLEGTLILVGPADPSFNSIRVLARERKLSDRIVLAELSRAELVEAWWSELDVAVIPETGITAANRAPFEAWQGAARGVPLILPQEFEDDLGGAPSLQTYTGANELRDLLRKWMTQPAPETRSPDRPLSVEALASQRISANALAAYNKAIGSLHS